MTEAPDPAALASELRVALGQLARRLRAEHGFPIHHGAVLGRLDREGARSIGQLATAERVRPQSMAQTVQELERRGLVARRTDPNDRRKVLVELTAEGRAALEADRRHREGWLAEGIADDLTAAERATLTRALDLLRRLTER
ncbi:MAG TPA: MarR family transcriptional regulator [Thermoleophilaceae bacterium]|jgi:DNA-binding MarR family transcriptional regulator|nr:MarR family transcriptional regulator [Thermoleophilaceae bacterium]